MKTKYPSTPYLTLCNSGIPQPRQLQGQQVVITEKMDGENTTISRGYSHARSLDSGHHPSRSWLKQWHGSIAHRIPEGIRICGENMYAKHSIAYDNLPSYFLGFSAWKGSSCLPWSETLEIFAELEIEPVPVLYQGQCNRRVLMMLTKDLDLGKQEGFVVRLTDGFELEDFSQSIGKWVRPGHVQTNKHWRHQAVVPNKLKED